jgi:hypothetical protein
MHALDRVRWEFDTLIAAGDAYHLIPREVVARDRNAH